MRSLIVTAGNEAFMPLLRGLIESLHQWEPRPFTDLACFDLGLTAQSRDWVAGRAAHVVTPAWDLPVDARTREGKPHLRALTARPFLPRYFPGYDAYLWIDADAWVQERFAIEWCLAAAADGALAAVPEVDRCYRQTPKLMAWRISRMQRCFGEEAGSRLLWAPYFNAGVFALRADAPHWALWAKWFGVGLAATAGTFCCDQSSLNYALWMERLPVTPLPALCNWLVHLALPRYEPARQCFCEPAVPGHPIGILHLPSGARDRTVEVRDGDTTRTISLRFPGSAGGLHAPAP